MIGAGGFALVVRARDESLDTDVAIKVLRPGPAMDLEIRERFVREARLLRRVRHPSVVTVHDIGETEDGRPYLVMDVAEGGTLGDRMGTVILPPDPGDVEAVVSALADGLSALHEAGVVHRDIKPANLLVVRDGSPTRSPPPVGRLLAPGERLVIGDLGLAKDQLATAYGPTMLGGTPGYMAPEQAEPGARIDRRTDVYASTAVLWVLVTGGQPPNPEQVPFKLHTLPEPWRAVIGSGMAADPADRYESMAAWADAARRAAGATAGAAPATMVAAPTTATLPYKGLAAFQQDDAALFFGRSELVDQLVARLLRSPVLVVGGPSGSGKSSVVRAGLLPALAGGALAGSERWTARILTPGRDPQTALADLGPDATFVVVDQLEELFTLCPDEGRRAGFVAWLERLVGRGGRVVLALRADFYGECAAYPWLAEAITENNVLVGPMTELQLREVIVAPARAVGLHVEGALVDRILADAGTDAGALPLIAHALVETWLRRDENRLTLEGYEAAGGVGGAIGRTAEEVWQKLDADGQRRGRRLLLRLVQPGDGTPDTRRLLTWDEVGVDEDDRRVLSSFAASRLLTLDDRGAELAHEALIRSWERLASWLDEDRDELRAAVRIEAAAREWSEHGRDPDRLLRGGPLAAALDWRAGNDGALPEPAASFLAAGEARERRAHRVRRGAITALAVLTAVALIALVVAGGALSRSRRDERTAIDTATRSLASTAGDIADTNPYLATALAVEALTRDPTLRSARDALVRARTSLAGDRLVPLGDPIPVGDAVALAMRSDGAIAATGDRSGGVVLWDLVRRAEVARLRGPENAVQGLAFTADGNWLVAAGADERVWRWDVRGSTAADPDGSVIAEPGSKVWAVASAPSGTTVAATTQRGDVLVVDAATGRAVTAPLQPGGGELLSVAFGPDGDTLLAGSGQGTVYGWSIATREPRFPPVRAHTSEVWELLVRPGGAGFITVSSDGTVKLWDTRTGAAVTPSPFDGVVRPDEEPRGATFGPDGDVITVGDADGNVHEWSLAEGRSTGPPQRQQFDRIRVGARSADARALVTLSEDQTVQAWSQRSRPGPLAVIARLATAATSIAVAPDGRHVAVGSDDGTVHVFDGSNGVERHVLEARATALTFSDPRYLVTGDDKGGLRRWDIESGRRAAERRNAHRGGVTALAVGSDLVSGGNDGAVRSWDPSTLAPRKTLGSLQRKVTDVDAARDRIVAANDRARVARWKGGSRVGESVTVAPTDNTVWSVAALEDGFVTGDHNEALVLWRGFGDERPREAARLGGMTGGAHAIALTGSTLAVGSGKNPGVGALQLVDAETAGVIGDAFPFDAAAWTVAAAPDGTVWVATKDGTVARIDALSVQVACAIAGESFDARQRGRLMGEAERVSCTG